MQISFKTIYVYIVNGIWFSIAKIRSALTRSPMCYVAKNKGQRNRYYVIVSLKDEVALGYIYYNDWRPRDPLVGVRVFYFLKWEYIPYIARKTCK